MQITEKTKTGQVAVFEINGRLDTLAAPELDRQLQQSLTTHPPKVVMDCGNLEYITGPGLRVLHKIAGQVQQARGTLVLCALADYLQEIFQLAGMDRCVPMVDTLHEAVTAGAMTPPRNSACSDPTPAALPAA